jgi:HD-like signal output (HDOD) protein
LHENATTSSWPQPSQRTLASPCAKSEIGSALAHKLSLPEALAEAIRYHHAPQRSAA